MNITGGISELLGNLEQVQEDTTVIKAKGVVKSVQRGVFNKPNNETVSISINAVNEQKSILLGHGPIRYYDQSITYYMTLESNSVTIYGSSKGQVSWQVIEFY